MANKIPNNVVLKQLENANSSIEIIGKYQTKGAPLEVRCRKCGFEWSTTANRILAGCGCRKCSGVQRRGSRRFYRKTHADFVEDVNRMNTKIIVLSEYKSARNPVVCRCSICGNEWSARPYNILSGTGCPACSRASRSFKQRKTHEQFVSELSAINCEITVVGSYAGYHNNVNVKCNKCGYEWFATPANLLRTDGMATGCPQCSNSHGEQRIAMWLSDRNIAYIPQKRFDGLLGVGGGSLSYDFYLPHNNMLIEYQGEYHNHSTTMQTMDDYEKQVEHDSRKREYAHNHGIRLLEIWYYENLEEKLINEFNNTTDPVTTTAS